MFQKSCLSLLVLLLLLFACTRDKKPLEPEKPSAIPSTMPQADIPWPSLADSPWPMSTVNPQGIARSRYVGPREGKLHWAIALENVSKMADAGPAIGPDGTIYCSVKGDMNGPGFIALTPDGHIKWSLEWDWTMRFETGPVVANDSTIYVGGTALYALRPDGTMKWRFEGESGFSDVRPLLGIDGTIYTKDMLGNIFALTPQGNLKWKSNMGLRAGLSYMVSSPDGSAIYAPGRDSTLIALDARKGTLLWSIKKCLNFYAGPTVDNEGNVYFYAADTLSDAGYVCSADPAGRLRWKFRVNSIGTTIPWAGISMDYHGSCYFDWVSKGITSLDYAGQLRWKLSYSEGSSDSPIICDSQDNIYVLNEGIPKLFCFSADGKLQFSVKVLDYDSISSRPGVITRDALLVYGTNTKWLVAVK